MIAPRGDFLHLLVVRLGVGVALGYYRRNITDHITVKTRPRNHSEHGVTSLHRCSRDQIAISDCGHGSDCPIPGRSVRKEQADFTMLVLGCIEAKFYK